MTSSLQGPPSTAPRVPAVIPSAAGGSPHTHDATRRALVYGMNGDNRTIDISHRQSVMDVARSIERVFDLSLCSDTETIDIICETNVLGWRDDMKRVSGTCIWVDDPGELECGWWVGCGWLGRWAAGHFRNGA